MEVIAGPEPAPLAGTMAAELRAAFYGLNEGDGFPVGIDELVMALARTAPGLVVGTVLPPLGELLEACGFVVRGNHTALAGADWAHFDRLRAVARVGMAHELGVEGCRALVTLCELFDSSQDGRLDALSKDAEAAGAVANLLSDPDLGLAFAEATRDAPADELLHFTATIAGAARHHRAGPQWLAATAAFRSGNPDQAASLLADAVRSDPSFGPALEEAAHLASDRGDAEGAVKLLRRVGDEDRAGVISRFTTKKGGGAGRNEPCPCGSGRKYKHCCLNRPVLSPLPDRVGWLWTKLVWFLTSDDPQRRLLGTCASLLAHGVPAPQPGEPEDGPIGREVDLAASLALFHDGALADFLALRGPLLPEDERNLAAQWGLTDPSAHEVIDVVPGQGLSLRDLRTGDEVEVREQAGSTWLAAGDLVYAHPVPDGMSHQIVGGIVPISLYLRDLLLALLDAKAPAEEIGALLASTRRPPTLVNTEGEPTVLCEARYRVDDPAVLASLDGRLQRDDDTTWSESIEVDDRTWLRGTVLRDGDELVVTANSEVRFARLRALVEDTVAGIHLVDERHEQPDHSKASRPPELQTLPPKAGEMLDSFMRQEEARWVDEPVPALGGLTPRQAVADPTRREEVVSLLHELDRHPPPPGAAGFDTTRLRERLGLKA